MNSITTNSNYYSLNTSSDVLIDQSVTHLKPPTYIQEQLASIGHSRFGNSDNFAQASQAIVLEMVKWLRRETKQNPSSLFLNFMELLAAKRQKIAIETHTNGSLLFGMPRSKTTLLTLLIEHYQAYADKLLLQNRVPECLNDMMKNRTIKLTLPYTHLGEEGAFTLQRFSLDLLDLARTEQYSQNNIPEIVRIYRDEHRTAPEYNQLLKSVRSVREGEVLLVTISHKIQGEHIPLSQFTMLTQHKDHVDLNLKQRMLLGHTQHQYIKPICDSIAPIFTAIMQWDGRSETALRDLVALMVYKLSHATPFKRGSAAITDWIEMIAYFYHGLIVQYNPDRCVNLEALISTWPDFHHNYSSCIHLTHINDLPLKAHKWPDTQQETPPTLTCIPDKGCD